MTRSALDRAQVRCIGRLTVGMFWYSPRRDVVRVEGADARVYLHSQLSQDVLAMAVGDSAWSLVLQPNGKVDVLLRVWRVADEDFVLDTDGGFGEELVSRLNRFKIRVKASIEPLDWRCAAVRGGAVDPGIIEGGIVGWGGGVDLLGPDVRVDRVVDVDPGSVDDYTDARIAAAWPAMGAEIIPGETIPAATGVVSEAVSFTKGCYPGQELVERMDSRGSQTPFHLVVLDRAAGDVVGGDVAHEGATVGTITSVGRRQVLARVRRGVAAFAR
jgi:tRNA-modifying protein YgfZ